MNNTFLQKIRITLFIMLCCFGQLFGQDDVEMRNFTERIASFEADNPAVSFTCSFIEQETGEEVLFYNRKSVVPASIMKVVSGATAMKVLGPDYRFKTKLGITGKIDSDGVLNGDLIVIGGGDPTVESKYFGGRRNIPALFVNEIVKQGIKKIEGGIVIDLSHYGNLNVPGSWLYEDIGNYYGAGPSSLSCYDNNFLIELSSGKTGTLTKVVKTKPQMEKMRIVNFVKASKSKRDNAWVYSAPFSYDQQIRGTIPAFRKSFTVKASLPNPPLLFGTTLRDELQKKGIDIEKVEIKLRFAKATDKVTLLYTDQSPMLSEIEKPMLHNSINLIADHVYLQAACSVLSHPNFNEAGNWLLSYWRRNGVETKGNFVEDGSGLSRSNAVQSKFIASVLQTIGTDSIAGEAFINALPQVGIEGTVRNYFKSKPFATRMRAKTGSMTRVRSLAGKVQSKTEKQYYFCLITNNYSCSRNDLLTFYSDLFEYLYNNY